MADSPTQDKSYRFASKIIDLSRRLEQEQRAYVLARQVLRSGTSIGANVEEASGGLTRKEFAAKLSIASKEARETRYWLRLLRDSNYAEKDTAAKLLKDCEELIRLLTASVKSLQQKTKSEPQV